MSNFKCCGTFLRGVSFDNAQVLRNTESSIVIYDKLRNSNIKHDYHRKCYKNIKNDGLFKVHFTLLSKRLSFEDKSYLYLAKEYFKDTLPGLLCGEELYDKYTDDIIFVNHIWKPYKKKGKSAYKWEIFKLRKILKLIFSERRFEILHIGVTEETDTINVRWRVNGVSRAEIVTANLIGRSLDGYSTLSVNKEGLCYYHKVDKIIPVTDENNRTLFTWSTLAAFFGLQSDPMDGVLAYIKLTDDLQSDDFY